MRTVRRPDLHPWEYASDEELVALCRVMTSYGGCHCPHYRNYESTAHQVYTDGIDVARAAGVTRHLTHTHLNWEVNRGCASELVALIDTVLADRTDFTFNSFPYTAGAICLRALLPGWAHDGGPAPTLGRLTDPDGPERIRVELEETGSDGVPVDSHAVVISSVGLSETTTATSAVRWDETADQAGQAPADLCFDLLYATSSASRAWPIPARRTTCRPSCATACTSTGARYGTVDVDGPHTGRPSRAGAASTRRADHARLHHG